MIALDILKSFGKLFQGILIDTGAAKENAARNLQYLAYCSDAYQTPFIETSVLLAAILV